MQGTDIKPTQRPKLPAVRVRRATAGPTPFGAGLWAGLHIALLSMLLALAAGMVRAGSVGSPMLPGIVAAIATTGDRAATAEAQP
jgi:hypothetical protein